MKYFFTFTVPTLMKVLCILSIKSFKISTLSSSTNRQFSMDTSDRGIWIVSSLNRFFWPAELCLGTYLEAKTRCVNLIWAPRHLKHLINSRIASFFKITTGKWRITIVKRTNVINSYMSGIEQNIWNFFETNCDDVETNHGLENTYTK